MALETVRRIRGNAHDSIDISELEDAVLAHPYVQRMRRIKQLAFLHYVFPGATHTRFEHSLGVLQLAGVAWKKLAENQQRLLRNLERYGDYPAMEMREQSSLVHGLMAPSFALMNPIFNSDYLFQVLRLAALLHDLGHPPFSHSGELFLPSWTTFAAANQQAPKYIRTYLDDKIAQLVAQGKDPQKVRVRHEVYSILLIERVLTETYAKHPHLKLKPDPRDVISLIHGPAPAPDSELVKLSAHSLMCELISGELDIDRMDYLLRDSRECGVVYGIFDAGRILDSLYLYYDPKDQDLHIALSISGLAAFEDYLRARHSMYLQLYFHKSAVAGEAMLQHLVRRLPGWELPSRPEEYALIDEHNIGEELRHAATIRVAAAEQPEVQQLIRDLLYDRRLWKRVFELSNKAQAAPNQAAALSAAHDFLGANGFVHEQIHSGTSLTRFLPRGANQHSQNYLRVIKKDDRQFPRVYPIEDVSTLIANGDNSYIERIYVPDLDQNHPGPVDIRQALARHLTTELGRQKQEKA